MPDYDILSRLLPLKFRGIEIPALANDLELNHNLVEHNQYGVSGGEQENTCRKSVRYSFRCMFRNGIGWPKPLYPGVYREFWNACADRATGPMIHPEFGYQEVKVATVKIHYDPTWRDGCDLDVVWLETIEGGMSIEMSASSPISYAIGRAGDFDAIKGNISPVPVYSDGSGDSLLTALKKIQGAALLFQLGMADLAASIENVANGVFGMMDTLASVGSPSAWEAHDILSDVAASLLETTDALGATMTRKKIDIRTTKMAAPATQLAMLYSTPIEDFFKLNPMLATMNPVPPGTDVFVHAS